MKDEINVENAVEGPNPNEPMQFEDALTLTGFGKFNILLIFISGTVLSAVLLETLGLSFVLPVAQCELKLTTQDKGVLSAISFFGIIISSHLWGFLADTLGRKRIILPTLLISFTCTFISSFSKGFWFLLVFRFLSGLFISGSAATIYAYLSEFHNLRNRSRAILGASTVFGGGCIALPALAWIIINQDWAFTLPIVSIFYRPWRLFVIVCGFPSLICALLILIIPESPKFVLLGGNQEKTIDIIYKVYLMNGGSPTKKLNIKSIVDESCSLTKSKRSTNLKSCSSIFLSMWAQTAPLFERVHIRATFIACTIQFGVFILSNGVYMWFPDILNRVAEYTEIYPEERITICDILVKTKNHIEEHEKNSTTIECSEKLDISAYENTFILELSYAVGYAITGMIVNIFGKLPIMVFCLLISALCGVAVVYTTIPMISIYLFVVLLLSGLALPLVNAAIVELYPTNLRAMAVCITLMMGRLGSVVGANLTGYLLDYNCPATFYVLSIDLIVCAILSFFIPNIIQRMGRKLVFN